MCEYVLLGVSLIIQLVLLHLLLQLNTFVILVTAVSWPCIILCIAPPNFRLIRDVISQNNLQQMCMHVPEHHMVQKEIFYVFFFFVFFGWLDSLLLWPHQWITPIQKNLFPGDMCYHFDACDPVDLMSKVHRSKYNWVFTVILEQPLPLQKSHICAQRYYHRMRGFLQC